MPDAASVLPCSVLYCPVFYTAQCSILPSGLYCLLSLPCILQAHVFCEPLMYFEPHPYFACPLDHRARRVLGLFARGDLTKFSDAVNLLGIYTRQIRELLSKWSEQRWLEIADPSRGGRKYRLMKEYRVLLE